MSTLAGEFAGTLILVFVGCCACANASLSRTIGGGMGWGALAAAWGAAVAAGMVASMSRGSHLNPAVSLAMWSVGRIDGAELGAAVAGQFLGAAAGAVLAWLSFLPSWSRTDDHAAVRAAFVPAPAVRAPLSTFLAEAAGSAVFALVMLRLLAGRTVEPAAAGDLNPTIATPLAAVDPLSAALVAGATFAAVMLGVGGAGAALHPARAVGGRLAHALLPGPGRGVGSFAGLGAAVIGPCVGALVAAAAWRALVG
ncbi:MAG: aquaporin [Phycisphaerales bacterium]